jgi:UDP-GlcNAc:undecaprenyl-phosphate GlcNAc-1-phosphate transferase
MTVLLAILGLSLGLALLLTPLVRALAPRFGLVDHPDGKRKTHARPTPVGGGVAVLVATSGALAIGLAATGGFDDACGSHGEFLLGLFVAGTIICVVGLADDLWGLRGRHKVLGQLVAIVVVMYAGVVVERIQLFNWCQELGLLAIPFTVFWLLGAINSLNLMDGMDGLLGCVGTIISLAIAVMAVLSNSWVVACLAVALAGALLGFLRYNFPPASIFLGDAGSMLIGLVLGVLAIRGALKGPATIALAAPVAILTVPILDTTAAIVRRKLTGRSLYTTDHGHLHHCLLRHNLSCRGVLLGVSGLCCLTVAAGVVSLSLNNELFAILTSVSVACILVVTRLFGYAEFVLARDHFLETVWSLLHARAANPAAHQIEVRLHGSGEWKELWHDLTARAPELNLAAMCLDVNAPAMEEGYHARWNRRNGEIEDGRLWRAEIPVMAEGQMVGRLEAIGPRDGEAIGAKLATLTQLLDSLEKAVSARNGPSAGGPHARSLGGPPVTTGGAASVP